MNNSIKWNFALDVGVLIKPSKVAQKQIATDVSSLDGVGVGKEVVEEGGVGGCNEIFKVRIIPVAECETPLGV